MKEFGSKKLENFYELKFNRNSLNFLGTLEFAEIWLASSLSHLIARKIKFLAKEDQNLNSNRKGKLY
jgi:hypothetical protein